MCIRDSLQIDPNNLTTPYLQDNNTGINNNLSKIFDHLGSLDHHIHVLEDAVGITNGVWGFTTILNGILQVTTYASVQSQLTSHQAEIDSLQAQCNVLQSEITGDEGAISRLENLTQNIDLTKTVAGSTNLNGNVVVPVTVFIESIFCVTFSNRDIAPSSPVISLCKTLHCACNESISA